MTLILGAIAVLLFIVIVGAVVASNRDDGEIVGFTQPQELSVAAQVAAVTSQAGPLIDQQLSAPTHSGPFVDIAPEPVSEQSFEQVLAEKEAEAAQTFSLATFLPGNLGVGTTLMYRGVNSTIFGVISFEFNGVLWQDYLAEHAAGQWWRFGVEPDRGMKLAAFEPRMLGVDPGPPAIEFEGSMYQVTDSGHASYRTAGQTSHFDTGRYWYFDYESKAGVILSFERFDSGPWISSIGHHVDPRQVQVSNALPGF